MRIYEILEDYLWEKHQNPAYSKDELIQTIKEFFDDLDVILLGNVTRKDLLSEQDDIECWVDRLYEDANEV